MRREGGIQKGMNLPVNNKERLAQQLMGRMTSTARKNIPTTVELGIINGDLSLTVDSIARKIPQEDYMIDLQLTHETYYTYTELNSSANAPHHHEGGEHAQAAGTGHHTHDDGLHDHRVSSVFRRIQPGDRVLVIWVGFEPIIVAIVVPGTTITPN